MVTRKRTSDNIYFTNFVYCFKVIIVSTLMRIIYHDKHPDLQISIVTCLRNTKNVSISSSSLPLPRSQYLKDWNRFRVRTAIGREGGALLKPLPCTRENSMKLCPPPISSPINQTVDLSLLVIRALELFSSSQSKRVQKGLAFSLGKTNPFSFVSQASP